MSVPLTVEEAEEKEFLDGYHDQDFAPAEKAAADQAVADQVAADKLAAEKAGGGEQTEDEKAAAEKAAADQAVADQVAADKLAAEKAGGGEQTEDEKAAAEKAAADQAVADHVAADKLAADKLAAEKAYQPDYAKLLKDTAAEITRDNREVLSRITKKTETTPPVKTDPAQTAAEVTKALEGISDDQIKQTLQKVRDTDPETADAIEGLFSKVTGTVGSLAKAVDTMRVSRDADQAKAEEDAKASSVAQVETTIAAKHPDFRTIVGSFDGTVAPSAEFMKWFGEQPAYLQETARNTDSPDVFVSVLDKFVTDTKPEQTEAEKAADERAAAEKAAAEKAVEEARRAGARQPGTKAHAERKATDKSALNDDDEWMKGYNDPAFDKKK